MLLHFQAWNLIQITQNYLKLMLHVLTQGRVSFVFSTLKYSLVNLKISLHAQMFAFYKGLSLLDMLVCRYLAVNMSMKFDV